MTTPLACARHRAHSGNRTRATYSGIQGADDVTVGHALDASRSWGLRTERRIYLPHGQQYCQSRQRSFPSDEATSSRNSEVSQTLCRLSLATPALVDVNAICRKQALLAYSTLAARTSSGSMPSGSPDTRTGQKGLASGAGLRRDHQILAYSACPMRALRLRCPGIILHSIVSSISAGQRYGMCPRRRPSTPCVCAHACRRGHTSASAS